MMGIGEEYNQAMALSDEDKQWLVDHFTNKEDLENLATKLLTAFHSWASPVEARQRGQRELLHALDLQVQDLEDRMRKLEGRAQ
jgi:hypothetical protein